MVPLCALVLMALLSARAVIAQVPPKPPPAVSETRAAESRVPEPMLLRVLSAEMDGERVIAVGFPGGTDLDRGGKVALHGSWTLLQKLQVLGEAAGPENPARAGGTGEAGAVCLVPFRIRTAWVLAPERREEYSADLGAIPALQACWRGDALDIFLTSLTPEEMRLLGSEAGLPVARLRGVARAALLRALDPPLAVTRTSREGFPVSYDETGPPAEPVGEIPAALDRSGARVFARLEVPDVDFASLTVNASLRRLLPSGSLEVGRGISRPPPLRGAVLQVPPFPLVPNAYKPSDLEGRRFIQTLGLRGIHTVGAVVDRMRRVTGLELYAAPEYTQVPVFLGTESLACGEVMDALRLALCGAWRRLGSAYILAWDCKGLAPLQLAYADASVDLARRINDQASAIYLSPAWMALAESLPFDVDDPLGLTPDQHDAMLSALREEGMPQGIAWPRMTPPQQDYVRREVRRQGILTFSQGAYDTVDGRPLSEEDLFAASFSTELSIALSVDIPGIGRARIASEWGAGANLHERLRQIVESEKARTSAAQTADEPSGHEDEDGIAADLQPQPLPSPIRALMVPVLSPARIGELAGEMRRHGFNTLLYPALFDGYASFPTESFPRHPALRDANGLSAACSTMRDTGIQVVAYLSTLAWQGAGENVHWMRRHRAWLDMDLLGRSRGDYTVAYPRQPPPDEPLLFLDPFYDADYVSPAEPAVVARLHGLLQDLSTQDGLLGVALADWEPGGTLDLADDPADDADAPSPPLGYTLNERLAYLRAHGVDPVDASLSPPPFLPRGMEGQRDRLTALMEKWESRPDPHVLLAGELIASARRLRPEWAAWLISTRDEASDLGAEIKGTGAPDLRIGSPQLFGVLPDASLIVPVPPVEAPPEVPVRYRDGFMGALYAALLIEARKSMPEWRPAALALDFRAAPGLITETLNWFVPPKKP